MRPRDKLDRFLAAVKADYLDYDGTGRGVENFWVRWTDGGPRYVICFRKAFDPTRPLLLHFGIDWSQVRTPVESRSFYRESIPPPPGYEDVSMEAPEKFGPDSQADILAAQGIPIAGDRPASEWQAAQTAALEEAGHRAADPVIAEDVKDENGETAPLWPWIAGILALLGVGAVLLKRRG